MKNIVKIPMACAVACLAFVLSPAMAGAAAPAWICSTAKMPWQRRPLPAIRPDPAAIRDVVIHARRRRQRVDGFGGCFNELGWKVLLTLPRPARMKVMRALFGSGGCGFTLARLPIGASDYARGWYSLDDTPGDLKLSHFSIARDRGYLLRYVNSAMAVRPGLRVWISAWSPPAWMKTNGQYNGGRLKTAPDIQEAYARYLARAVLAYQHAGLHIYACMVQNEPKSNNNYPTCLWSGLQERNFIAGYMGPVFRKWHVKAGIWLGTINDANPADFAIPVLSDPAAARYVAGVAYQWEGVHAVAATHRLFPGMKLMQSENQCWSGADSFADAEHTFALVRAYFNGGVSSYFYWNMVLGPGGISTWGWKQDSMITVNPKTRSVTYHPEFYLMKQLAHFVRPGSHLAVTTGRWIDKLAFVASDGRIVLLIGNSANRPLPAVIGFGRRTGVMRLVLPRHSLNTLIIPQSAD